MLGAAELEDLLQDPGHVELTCEFCNRSFRYEDADVAAILKGATPAQALH
jgi:redox-regulated HSP33 family molecular chaperone